MNSTLSILIIEKDLPLQHTLALLFRRAGYNVDSEQVSLQVLKFLETNPCDLIVLDLSQTNDYGLSLFYKIKMKYPLLPIILLSSSHENEIIPCINEEEMWVLVRKPFEPGSLLRTVNAVACGLSIVDSQPVQMGKYVN
ncbi:MAG: response regulator [Anaerolineaceae bacterium]|jgi:two-component system response regulator HydG